MRFVLYAPDDGETWWQERGVLCDVYVSWVVVAFRSRSLIYDHEPSIIENPKACLRRLLHPMRTFAVESASGFLLSHLDVEALTSDEKQWGEQWLCQQRKPLKFQYCTCVYTTKTCVFSSRVYSILFYLTRFDTFLRRLIHRQSMTTINEIAES